jgi:hypothetical protein
LYADFQLSWLVAIDGATQLATNPSSFVYLFFYYLTAPLYCNSVLANLTSRDYVRGHSQPATVSLASGIEFNPPQILHGLSKVSFLLFEVGFDSIQIM